MKDIPLSVRLERGDGKIEMIGKAEVNVKKEGQGAGSFFIVMPRKALAERKSTFYLELMQGNRKIDRIKTTFLGPVIFTQ